MCARSLQIPLAAHCHGLQQGARNAGACAVLGELGHSRRGGVRARVHWHVCPSCCAQWKAFEGEVRVSGRAMVARMLDTLHAEGEAAWVQSIARELCAGASKFINNPRCRPRCIG